MKARSMSNDAQSQSQRPKTEDNERRVCLGREVESLAIFDTCYRQDFPDEFIKVLDLSLIYDLSL